MALNFLSNMYRDVCGNRLPACRRVVADENCLRFTFSSLLAYDGTREGAALLKCHVVNFKFDCL